jgi:hypothetical protein
LKVVGVFVRFQCRSVHNRPESRLSPTLEQMTTWELSKFGLVIRYYYPIHAANRSLDNIVGNGVERLTDLSFTLLPLFAPFISSRWCR